MQRLRIISATALAIVAMLAFCPTAGAWELVQVGPHERLLEITYHFGACETTSVQKVQSRRRIEISVSSQQEVLTGNESCPAIEYRRTLRIALTRPLDGRPVEGGERGNVEDGPYVGPGDGTRYPAVPRLTGLSPGDAKFLLRGLRLNAVVHVVGETSGLPRVVSQSPAAGTRDPKNRIIRVSVLR